ncbi:MAG TPA: hypothetical protein EYH34_04990 [Planctomycetes bacterium]|nr:hypothetical protein [Planctomycetota bacterium]
MDKLRSSAGRLHAGCWSPGRQPAQAAGRAPPGQAKPAKLWKEIDIGDYRGSFPCLGDLDGDGRSEVVSELWEKGRPVL